MALDQVNNFGKSTVTTGYSNSATSIVVTDGSRFPDPASGNFNVAWWNSTDYFDPSDDPNREIVRVTAKSSNTLTVTRAQEGTSATSKNTTDKTYTMILAPTAKMITDIGTSLGTKVAGPGSSTDNAVMRWDGTGGYTAQNSVVTVDDTGVMAGASISGSANTITNVPISTGVSGLGAGVATLLGTPSSANLAAALTDETGTGSAVFANTPTLVTPILGTPTSGTLTNCTGLPISTGVSGLGSNVATFLATPSSANLAAALTDETGTGSAVFGTSPTITTSLATGSSSFDLINTNATTVNFAGAATTLNIGGSGAAIKLGGGATAAELRFMEPSGSGTNYTAFKAQAQAGDVTYTLPAADGTSGYVLQTNGSGTLSWVAQSGGGGGGTPGGSDTQVQFNDAGSFGGDAGFTYNKTTDVATLGGLLLSGLTASSAVATDGSKNLVSVTNTGSGNNVLATSPTLTTPVLGVATATSINKVAITAPATSATLTLADGSSLVTSGANSITLTSSGATNVTLPTTGTLATLAGAETLSSKTLTAPKFANGGFIADANGNEEIIFTTTASAVNEITIANAATGNGPTILTTGGNTNAPITLGGKGTGAVRIGQATSVGVDLLADQPIRDSSSNELISFTKTASATTQVNITNAATGTTGPLITPAGETNVDLRVGGTGTGKIHNTTGEYGDITTDTDGATVTFNMATSNIHQVTLGGNRTMAVSNVGVGQCFMIRLVQDGTGSRTVTWFSTIKWAGGSAPTLTTTANKTDVLGFLQTSSGNYDGFVIGQNL